MKTCVTCETEKDLSEFGKHKGYAGGHRNICNVCKNEDALAHYHKTKHLKPYNYEYDKDKKLKKAYGIGYAEYLTMLEAQNNACAICGTKDTGNRKAFHVDHCHDTGKIRGLLCGNCNSGIGNLRDDINLLQRAIAYLQSTKE